MAKISIAKRRWTGFIRDMVKPKKPDGRGRVFSLAEIKKNRDALSEIVTDIDALLTKVSGYEDRIELESDGPKSVAAGIAALSAWVTRLEKSRKAWLLNQVEK